MAMRETQSLGGGSQRDERGELNVLPFLMWAVAVVLISVNVAAVLVSYARTGNLLGKLGQAATYDVVMAAVFAAIAIAAFVVDRRGAERCGGGQA